MLTKSQLREKMLEIASENYPDYPYHNYEGHVLSAIEAFTNVYYWLNDLGIEIDFDAGVITLAHHDRDYDKNPVDYGFSTKEELSASLATKDLQQLGADQQIIKTVYDGIIATTAEVEPADNLQQAIKIADLCNVFGDTKLFLYNTYLVILEAIVTDQQIHDSFDEYCHYSVNFLKQHFKNPIVFYHNDKVVPYQPMIDYALENIKVLESITIEKFIQKIANLAPNAKDKLPNIWFD